MMMEKPTVCVIFKTKPGMRENMKTAWEEYIKPHVIINNDILQAPKRSHNSEYDNVKYFSHI
jgi:hypothetical protein